MVKYHYNHWLPPLLGASGVTLGRHIFFKEDNPSQTLIKHEMCHVRQYIEYGFFGFLSRYFYHYLKGRFRGLSHWKAYERIPFEVEARIAEKKIDG